MASTQQIEVIFEDAGPAITTIPGRSLMDICDEFNTPILFGCRSASCGTCLIRVTSGGDNLSPITSSEAILLTVLADNDPEVRLACQCIVNGSIRLKTLE